MLLLFSILLSIGITLFCALQSIRLFRPYRHTIQRIETLDQSLRGCQDGKSIVAVANRLTQDEDAVTRDIAQSLLRTCTREPVRAFDSYGWMIDLDYMCDGKRYFRIHPSYERTQAMASLLTGAGILFTFLGLALGISGLDPSDAEQLTEGVKTLLGGMSIAFLTSITGIAGSLWWTWAQKSLMGHFESAFYALYQTLHVKPFLFLPEELNAQMLAYQAQEAEAGEDLESRVQRAFVSAFEQVGLAQLPALLSQSGDPDQRLGPTLEAIQRELSHIGGSYQQVTQLSKDMAGVFDRLMKERQTLVDQQQVGVQDQVRMATGTQEAIANVARVHQTQEATIKAMNEAAVTLRKLITSSQSASNELLKNQQMMLHHMNRLEKHWDDYGDQLKTLQDNLKDGIQQFHERLRQSLLQVHEEMDGILAQSMTHFQAGLKDMNGSLEALALLKKTDEQPAAAGSDAPKSSWLGKRK
ncbi:hypothetical protein SCOR_15460 [Sulfidibacter corallicola]|uniref:MotA/TolQ/ExbB proton channel domain-containing protein n=1 Tax=Sulfidibacter corallicola TaxID=2818388 RepID=A0A8A4U5W4_SULCO|nr:hypothetical protein [Sulfidibacter corallicola]QTD54135.1 hypothetical protein J3U87_16945 [Sulfidibacter corallicola]